MENKELLQILNNTLELYTIYKKKGFEFDKSIEEEIKNKIIVITEGLESIPDLPE